MLLNRVSGRRRRWAMGFLVKWWIIFLIFFALGVQPIHAAPATTAPAFSCAIVTEIPQGDCEVLVALYQSTSGPTWTNHAGWLESSTPCFGWHGVVCANGRVTALGLYNNHLQGALPAALGNLTALKDLWLSGNAITGPLPSALGNLHALETLWLSQNQLTGTIPRQLGALIALRELRLDANQLTGAIPPELGNLVTLQKLWLHQNQLTSAIPPELGNLAALQELWLSANQLSGALPGTLPQLAALEQLALSANPALTGALPRALMELSQLDLFHFSNTALCEPTDATFQNWLQQIRQLARNGQPCTDEPPPTPTPTPKPLVLIYAALDNDLGEDWSALVNNVEAGTSDALQVRLFVDGAGADDVYQYDIQHDTNRNCPNLLDRYCSRYPPTSKLSQAYENAADPTTLYEFITKAITAYPHSSPIVLALVGHGSGWGANVRPAQPRIYHEQGGEDLAGGMLWDGHTPVGGVITTTSRSLSTQALGEVLTDVVTATGKAIDLLYLDGCSMGMAEVAYEVRSAAHFMVASPNTDWASFSYDQLLPLVATPTPLDRLAVRWLQTDAAVFRTVEGYPFTLTAIDLTRMTALQNATSTLADTLRSQVAGNRATIQAAALAADRFESNYDGKLDSNDSYVDLLAFTRQLQQTPMVNSQLLRATQAVQSALTAAIVISDTVPGVPLHYPGATWAWPNFGGLSIYLPLQTDEVKRRLFYHEKYLAWARDGHWDEWLAAFWGTQAIQQAGSEDLPICNAGSAGCPGLARPLPIAKVYYLPLIIR